MRTRKSSKHPRGFKVCSSPAYLPWMEQRFWSRVNKTEDCWLWTGKAIAGPRHSDRPVVSFRGHSSYVARIAWILQVGEIPNGLSVLHHCDVPRCVRRDHLFLGTHLDNMRDMTAKGRNVFQQKPWLGGGGWQNKYPDRVLRGERHGRSKLTQEAVRTMRQLRADGIAYSDIAVRFNIAKSTARDAIVGFHWGHLASTKPLRRFRAKRFGATCG